MQRLQFYLLGLAPLLLAFFVWDLELATTFPLSDQGATQIEVPESIVENPKVLQFNQLGRLQQIWQGSSLQSFRQGNRIVIQEPWFLFSEESGAAWRISSDTGYFLEPSDIFQMEGQVEMQRESTQTPLHLSTARLEISLSGNIIRTAAEVVIQAPGHLISGTGFTADLNTNKFNLLHQVVARHEQL